MEDNLYFKRKEECPSKLLVKKGPLLCITHIYCQAKKTKQKVLRIHQNLKERVEYHNAGKVTSTKNFIPWKVAFYAGFTNKKSALAFERYLKTASGKAFANKRLLY